MDSNKNKKNEDNSKIKDKAPIYIFQSEIESLVDINIILKERIMDAKI